MYGGSSYVKLRQAWKPSGSDKMVEWVPDFGTSCNAKKSRESKEYYCGDSISIKRSYKHCNKAGPSNDVQMMGV